MSGNKLTLNLTGAQVKELMRKSDAEERKNNKLIADSHGLHAETEVSIALHDERQRRKKQPRAASKLPRMGNKKQRLDELISNAKKLSRANQKLSFSDIATRLKNDYPEWSHSTLRKKISNAFKKN